MLIIHVTMQPFSHYHLTLGGIVNQASGMDRRTTEVTKTEAKGKRKVCLL